MNVYDFYPRPPRGGRPGIFSTTRSTGFISIHALREEGDACAVALHLDSEVISIHALREEGDRAGCGGKPPGRRFLSTPSARRATRGPRRVNDLRQISIHALREEGDLSAQYDFYSDSIFLSTPSARRATPVAVRADHIKDYFYPRPPRGGRRRAAGVVPLVGLISIHALREEGDTKLVEPLDHPEKFLSTPSARRATRRAAESRNP